VRIYKYHIRMILNSTVSIRMPIGAEIISTQMQDGELFCWAVVEPDADTELRAFKIVPTGVDFHGYEKHLTTIQHCGLVYHIFEA